MIAVDSHQHFWNYSPQRHPWMSDEMTVLKRDFLPDDLFPLLKQCSIQACVAVQASQTEEENTFLLTLANQNDFIKGVVGWIDLQSNQVEQRLTRYSNSKKMKGFRHVIHDEADVDFMLRPNFVRGIGLLKQFDFTYDLLIFPKHLPNTLKLVRKYPDQPFVIDHIAKPIIREGKIENWKKELAAIASCENVCCKVSGMVTEANWQDWRKEDFTPYLDAVVEMFGTNRLMYGSDWPVCQLSASYQDVFGIVSDYFSSFSKSERESIFGGNATRFYRL